MSSFRQGLEAARLGVILGETSGIIREDVSPLGGWLWWVNVEHLDGTVYRDMGITYTRWGAERKRRRGLGRAIP